MLSSQDLSAGLNALDESGRLLRRLRDLSLLDKRGRGSSTHYALPAGPDAGELKGLHFKPLRETGVLTLLHPDSEKHPHQAYLTVAEDQKGPGREA